jgi:Tfp pilus assembly protein PilP
MIRRPARVSRNSSRAPWLVLLAALAGGLGARAARAIEAATPAAPVVVAAPGAPVDALAKRLTELRHKVLRDEDFVEDEDSNRDPFHSYLRAFAEHVAPPESKKMPSAFEKVGLEDLALIAVITGGDAPRAMFRDASGYGQAVRRGDFLSRSGARITKILSDRVIVEITETPGSGEPRVVEKAILVNPEEAP